MPWYRWAVEAAMAQAVIAVIGAGLYWGTPLGAAVARWAFGRRER